MFNVRKCSILCAKCTTKRLPAGLSPGPLGELTALPHGPLAGWGREHPIPKNTILVDLSSFALRPSGLAISLDPHSVVEIGAHVSHQFHTPRDGQSEISNLELVEVIDGARKNCCLTLDYCNVDDRNVECWINSYH